MHFTWKKFWNRDKNADLERNRVTISKQQSPSFMSAFYDRTVRTNSYNEIVMKLDVLTGQIREDNADAGLLSSVHTDRLLEPTQEAVDALLQERIGSELPELIKMAIDFFENSRLASSLCGAILQSINQARGQCGRMDSTLAEMPRSGEALGFTQQQIMAQGLLEMVDAKNPFADCEACEMFTNVRSRYSLLSLEVEERRRLVGRKVKVLRRWIGGCIGVAVAMVAGATLVAVVVATHVVVSVAVAPVVVAAAAVARGKLQQSREDVNHQGMKIGDGDGPKMQEDGVVMAGISGVAADRSGLNADVVGAQVNGVEMGSTWSEKEAIRPDAKDRLAHMNGSVAVEKGGVGDTEGKKQEKKSCSGYVLCGAVTDSTRNGVRVLRRTGRKGGEWRCWGVATLAGQSAKLDALARGSFLVNRMLDTLKCLVTGLQDDVERNRRLVEFGWIHREEAVCVHQVGKQLFRSHMHLVRQLANLEEQVIVCFLLINKARDNVLQEYSPKV